MSLTSKNLRPFSTAFQGGLDAKVVPEVEPARKSRQNAVAKKEAPTMLVSEYGDLLSIRPVRTQKQQVGSQDLRQVRMVSSNANAADLLKQMQKNPNTYFLFDPESHFTNSRAVYKAIKALLDKKYFGNFKKAKLDEKYGEDIDVAEGPSLSEKKM